MREVATHCRSRQRFRNRRAWGENENINVRLVKLLTPALVALVDGGTTKKRPGARGQLSPLPQGVLASLDGPSPPPVASVPRSEKKLSNGAPDYRESRHQRPVLVEKSTRAHFHLMKPLAPSSPSWKCRRHRLRQHQAVLSGILNLGSSDGRAESPHGNPSAKQTFRVDLGSSVCPGCHWQ